SSRENCACNDAYFKRLLPEVFEGLSLFWTLALPIIANQVVGGCARIAAEQCHHLEGRMRGIVKGRNQGLHNSSGTVQRASITPAFEVVRHRDVPVAEFRRLVGVQTAVNAEP